MNAQPLQTYLDDRPTTNLRMPVEDHGIVLPYGDGPGQCDINGARDMTVFEDHGTFYMLYDGCGPHGWKCCLAISQDLLHWEKRGILLEHGGPNDPDCGYTGYGAVLKVGNKWHLYYVACHQTTPAPDFIPAMPYLTLKAEATNPLGPWTKRYDQIPFHLKPGTYYADTGNSNAVIDHQGEYQLFFSAAIFSPPGIKRTLGVARSRTPEGPWIPDPAPILPLEEQIENASLYYEPTMGVWFLFTNHVGFTELGEFRDGVWVYWTRDLKHWDPANKAVVVDGESCRWSKVSIGMPSVVPYQGRLALIYDAPGGQSIDNTGNSIALAWLALPLRIPT